MDTEEVTVTAGAATRGSADGLVRMVAGWGQKNHTPTRHSRHNKTNQRVRINLSQLMIISQKFR